MEPERSGERRSSDNSRDGGGEDGRSPDGEMADQPTRESPVDRTDEGASTAAAADLISVDELFDLLSRPGNRYILTYVVRSDGPVPYADLVEYVVDEGGTPEGISIVEFRNQIAARLVHSNLPKLDDAGLVAYDATEKTVEATDGTDIVVPYLELAMEQSLRR